MRSLGCVLIAAVLAPIGAAVAAETPLAVHIHSDRAMFQVLISPGRAGNNSFVLQLMNGDGTRLPAKSAALALDKAEGGAKSPEGKAALERKAALGADGYWHVDSVPMPDAGRWHMRIEAESVFGKTTLEEEFNLPAQ